MKQPAPITAPIAAQTFDQPIRPAAHVRSTGWVIRRALFGILTLSVFVLGTACLMYASIEPDATAVADQSQSE